MHTWGWILISEVFMFVISEDFMFVDMSRQIIKVIIYLIMNAKLANSFWRRKKHSLKIAVDSPNFELAIDVACIVDKGCSHYIHLSNHLKCYVFNFIHLSNHLEKNSSLPCIFEQIFAYLNKYLYIWTMIIS